jgi:hypothetical protein
MWDSLPPDLRANVLRERRLAMARQVLREEQAKPLCDVDMYRFLGAWRVLDPDDSLYGVLAAEVMRAHAAWVHYYA